MVKSNRKKRIRSWVFPQRPNFAPAQA